MASVANIYASVQADMKGFEQDLVKGAKTAGDKAGDVAGKSMATKIKDSFTKANLGKSIQQGLGLGVGLAGIAGIGVGISVVTEKIGQSLQLASDKAEAASKANVLFGESYHIIEEASKSAATSVGLSSGAYLTAAGNLGNLITNFGITGDAGANLSKNLVQLAADMGSFNNASTAEVTEAMGSAFVGETEPIRRFGVMLSAASIAAKAVELGLARSTKEVDQAAKVQATYALIVEQTSKAQGDFARTATGAANAQRISAAKMDEAMTKLGEKLAPIAQKLLPVVAEVGVAIVEVFGQLVSTAEELGRVVQQGIDFLDPGGAEIRKWVTELRAMPELVGLTDEQLTSAATSAQALGTGLAGATTAARELATEMERMAASDAAWDANRQSFDVARASLEELVAAYEAGNVSLEGFDRQVRNHIIAYPQLVTEADKLPPALYEIVKAQRDFMESMGQTVPEMAKTGAEMAAITEATTAEMAADWETLRSNQTRLVKDAMRDSIRAIQVGVVDMKERIKTGKEGFLEEVRLMAWQAKHPWAEENYADWLEKRIEIGNRKAKAAQRRGQEGQAAQWRAHVAALKEELMSLPQTAALAAERVIRALAYIRSAAIDARMTIGDQYYDPLSGRLISSFTSTRAVGGPASGMTWVGESGPELVNLPRGSHVNTARTSQAMARDAGGGGISEFTIHVESDGGRVQDIVLSVMGKVLGGASESAHIRYMNPVGA
jgi:hypothetical protein